MTWSKVDSGFWLSLPGTIMHRWLDAWSLCQLGSMDSWTAQATIAYGALEEQFVEPWAKHRTVRTPHPAACMCPLAAEHASVCDGQRARGVRATPPATTNPALALLSEPRSKRPVCDTNCTPLLLMPVDTRTPSRSSCMFEARLRWTADVSADAALLAIYTASCSGEREQCMICSMHPPRS